MILIFNLPRSPQILIPKEGGEREREREKFKRGREEEEEEEKSSSEIISRPPFLFSRQFFPSARGGENLREIDRSVEGIGLRHLGFTE